MAISIAMLNYQWVYHVVFTVPNMKCLGSAEMTGDSRKMVRIQLGAERENGWHSIKVGRTSTP
jgi:hypothetical protein